MFLAYDWHTTIDGIAAADLAANVRIAMASVVGSPVAYPWYLRSQIRAHNMDDLSMHDSPKRESASNRFGTK